MDYDALIHAEIQTARLTLIEKIAAKMAFDWLVNKGASQQHAFVRACQGYHSDLPSREFSPEEKAEYKSLWDKAARSLNHPYYLSQK